MSEGDKSSLLVVSAIRYGRGDYGGYVVLDGEGVWGQTGPLMRLDQDAGQRAVQALDWTGGSSA